ncbi:hypothetical protein ACTXMZ_16570 [Brachybacterium alimentarium]|uniref:hypothetical protein n=1 Tax=Brachybacterium alimentarium TaxID=47845 RepID=UPI003FD3E8CC
MSNEPQPLPKTIPADNDLSFPYGSGDELAGSTITALMHGMEPSVKLADDRVGTYYLEPGLNGGGTWHLRR